VNHVRRETENGTALHQQIKREVDGGRWSVSKTYIDWSGADDLNLDLQLVLALSGSLLSIFLMCRSTSFFVMMPSNRLQNLKNHHSSGSTAVVSAQVGVTMQTCSN